MTTHASSQVTVTRPPTSPDRQAAADPAEEEPRIGHLVGPPSACWSSASRGPSRRIGLLVTSFRTGDEHLASGWWSALFNPFRVFVDHPRTTAGAHLDAAGIPLARRSSTASSSPVPATVIPILFAAFAAYAFTFMRCRGRDIVFVIVVALLVVPIQVRS